MRGKPLFYCKFSFQNWLYIYIRFIDNEIVVNDKTARSTIRGEKSYKCSQDGIITNIFNKVICLSLNKLLAVHIVTDSFFAFSHISRNLQQVHYDEVSKCPLPNSTWRSTPGNVASMLHENRYEVGCFKLKLMAISASNMDGEGECRLKNGKNSTANK